jgi:hypothetical protein
MGKKGKGAEHLNTAEDNTRGKNAHGKVKDA